MAMVVLLKVMFGALLRSSQLLRRNALRLLRTKKVYLKKISEIVKYETIGKIPKHIEVILEKINY